MRLRHKYILIRIIPREQKIIVLRRFLGDLGSQAYRRATGEEIGPEVQDVKVGDVVLVGRFCGRDVDPDLDTRIIRESEIEAVVEE
jgi:hypothetical protein